LAGENLLAHAQVIFREMNEARIELQALGQWGRGRLRVAATTTACQYVLPQVLREFKESFPHCSIAIEPADSPECATLVEENRADLALCVEPRLVANLESRSLFEDDLQFIISPLHPWAKTRQPGKEEVAEQSYILYSKKSVTFQMVERYFAREHITLRTFIQLGSFEATKELVKLNLGVSILAPWVAKKEIEEGSLVAVPLGKRRLKRTWSILYRQGRRLGLPEETFIGLCKSATESMFSTTL
jgi:LysR family transcriptional regulator, low CO2-responsive transcriptional regulator